MILYIERILIFTAAQYIIYKPQPLPGLTRQPLVLHITEWQAH